MSEEWVEVFLEQDLCSFSCPYREFSRCAWCLTHDRSGGLAKLMTGR